MRLHIPWTLPGYTGRVMRLDKVLHYPVNTQGILFIAYCSSAYGEFEYGRKTAE